MKPDDYLTLDAAAHRLGVRAVTLSRWIARGKFPAYRTPGGRYRIAVADLTLALEPAARESTGKDTNGGTSRDK